MYIHVCVCRIRLRQDALRNTIQEPLGLCTYLLAVLCILLSDDYRRHREFLSTTDFHTGIMRMKRYRFGIASRSFPKRLLQPQMRTVTPTNDTLAYYKPA